MANNNRTNTIDLKRVGFDKYMALNALFQLDLSKNVELLHIDELCDAMGVFVANGVTEAQNLWQQLNELQANKKQISADTNILNEKIADLEVEIANNKSHQERLEHEKTILCQQQTESQAVLESTQQEAAEMRSALETVGQQLKLRDELRLKYAQYNDQKRYVKDDITLYRDKLDALPEAFKQQVIEKEQLEQQVKTKEQEIETITRQTSDITKQLESLEHLHCSLSQERDEKAQAIEKVQAQRQELESEIAAKLKQKSDQEKELEQSQKKLLDYIEADGSEAQFIKNKVGFLEKFGQNFTPNLTDECQDLLAEYEANYCTTDKDSEVIAVIKRHYAALEEVESNRQALVSLQQSLQDKIDVMNQEYRIKSASQQEGIQAQLEALRSQADDIIRQFKQLSEHFNKLGSIE